MRNGYNIEVKGEKSILSLYFDAPINERIIELINKGITARLDYQIFFVETLPQGSDEKYFWTGTLYG